MFDRRSERFPDPHVNRGHIHSFLPAIPPGVGGPISTWNSKPTNDPCVFELAQRILPRRILSSRGRDMRFPTDWLRVWAAEVIALSYRLGSRRVKVHTPRYTKPIPWTCRPGRQRTTSSRISSPCQHLLQYPIVRLGTSGASFNGLPADIRNQILQDLSPFGDPSLECSRILMPYNWLRALFHKDEPIIPWL